MAAPAPPMPPPMHELMRNKARNYECYRKQNSDGTYTFGFVVRQYVAADGNEKAIFVFHTPSGLRAEHVKMNKLELTGRENCSHIPHQDKLSLYADGGRRRTRRRSTRSRRHDRRHKN